MAKNKKEEIQKLFVDFYTILINKMMSDFKDNIDLSSYINIILDELKFLNSGIDEFLSQVWVSKKLDEIFEEIEAKK